MSKLKVAIGTNSLYKVNAIKKILHQLDLDFESNFDSVESKVTEQPHESGETKLGSINRAINILKKYPDADLGIGVEFGYEPIESKYHMVCWASIYTSNGDLFSEQSSTLELPKKLVDALMHKKSVGDLLDDFKKEISDNEVNRIFLEFIHKRKIISECTTNVMLRYLLDRDLYR